LLVNKKVRKNYKKNSAARKRARLRQRGRVALRITGGITALLAASMVLILGYDLLTQCQYFQAQSLTVSGTLRLSAPEVLAQGRLHPRQNILSVNLAEVRKRLLAHPWIAAAEVRRELPDGVAIRIREHTPLAILDLGREFLIDGEGRIFKEKTATDPHDLPVIEGLEFSDLNVPGASRSAPFEAVMEVLRAGGRSDSILPNRAIKTIAVDRQVGLTVYAFEKVRTIKLGYDHYPSKYRRLANVLCHLRTEARWGDFEVIDLNHAERIVISPPQASTAVRGQKEV